jgi:hypothetical protein
VELDTLRKVRFDRIWNLSYIGLWRYGWSRFPNACQPTAAGQSIMATAVAIFYIVSSRGVNRRIYMLKTGTKIVMTKGYKGVKGVITERTDSRFEFYIIKLDNGINIVVGPSAFIKKEDLGNAKA